jgi:SAM-dependent methyltransferase
MDPLAGSKWSEAETVAGFVQAPPNAVLLRFGADELRRSGKGRAIDLGCGAGRNAVPLARMGWSVLGVDLSRPMLSAARARARDDGLGDRLALAPMDRLPAPDHAFDLVIAHGIWNLAPSVAVFERALGEAARVSRPGAGLFVFTFSRSTLPPEAEPAAGGPFVFTQFSGQPQCFLTEAQLLSAVGKAGFDPDPAVPLTEHNKPGSGTRSLGGPPVIWECAFRYRG